MAKLKTKPSHIPEGAREILERCRTWDELKEVCRQQKYTCQMWLYPQVHYVGVLFGDPSTAEYRPYPDHCVDCVDLIIP
jgi:hypothetical protein